MTNNAGIKCEICGESIHAVRLHIKGAHPNITLGDYTEKYPDAPLLSDLARQKIQEKNERSTAKKSAATPPITTQMAGVTNVTSIEGPTRRHLHEVFGLPESTSGVKNSKGEPISITVMGEHKFSDLTPDVNENHVYSVELLKDVLMGLELNIPTYLWGHAGVGKSSTYEQVCAHTNRPMLRVQHTINTEEVHIVGQILANENGTYFEPGPLALAMHNGWVYNADEYDFAHPSVLAVYQAVLEGKPLVIKEAPADWRRVRPHPNFRFVASGNSNGSGDEHGLYPGVELGNSANYSRFGITAKVDYMDKAQEIQVICKQADILDKDAAKIVEFAHSVRKAFESQKMSATVGPRELIYAAKVGLRKGSWRKGLDLAYINRLNETDREVASGMSQRIFSGK